MCYKKYILVSPGLNYLCSSLDHIKRKCQWMLYRDEKWYLYAYLFMSFLVYRDVWYDATGNDNLPVFSTDLSITIACTEWYDCCIDRCHVVIENLILILLLQVMVRISVLTVVDIYFMIESTVSGHRWTWIGTKQGVIKYWFYIFSFLTTLNFSSPFGKLSSRNSVRRQRIDSDMVI